MKKPKDIPSWALEGTNTIETIVDLLSPEEVILIHMSIINEISVVFVSESMANITAAVSFFDASINPLRWPFALIYSLPAELMVHLESPMPFLAGVQMNEAAFLSDVYPNLTRNQKSCILFAFLDSGNLSPYEFNPQNIFLPHMGNIWADFIRDFSKYHGVKKSKHFELEKMAGTNGLLKFKMKVKPDKKVTRNKAKVKIFPPEQQVGRL